jgi:thiamine transporter
MENSLDGFRVALPASAGFFCIKEGFSMSYNLRRLTESAVMLAIATVLSLIQFSGPWVLGGSITVCSMLPLVFVAHRYGTRWGLVTALAYSLLQLLLGLKNVQYAPNALTAVGIILLDYVLAFGVLGFSAVFNGVIRDRRKAVVTGIAVTFFVRFLCHFASGVIIWEALWPNALGWAPVIWSLAYNGSYMLPEAVITATVAFLLFNPLRKYWLGEDVQKPGKNRRPTAESPSHL